MSRKEAICPFLGKHSKKLATFLFYSPTVAIQLPMPLAMIMEKRLNVELLLLHWPIGHITVGTVISL